MPENQTPVTAEVVAFDDFAPWLCSVRERRIPGVTGGMTGGESVDERWAVEELRTAERADGAAVR